jgi:hypothetical protein
MDMSETNDAATAKKKSGSLSELLHTWCYFFWLLGLVAVVMLFYAEENWRGEWGWEKHKREMRARGEQFDGSAFIPAPAPEEENFATTPYLEPLFAFVPGTQRWRGTNAFANDQEFSAGYNAASSLLHGKKGPHSNSWLRPRTDLVEWVAAFLQSTNSPKHHTAENTATNFTTQQAAAGVLAALAGTEPVIEEIRAASQRRRCRFNIHYEQDNPAAILLPHLAVLKHLSQVVQLRASAELALGQTDAAFQDVNLLLFLAEGNRDEPILVSQLVRFAQFLLALQPLAEGMGQWTEPQLRALQERLQRFDFCADSKRGLQAERVLFGGGIIDYFRRAPDKFHLIGELTAGVDGDHRGIEFVGTMMAAAPDGWLDMEQLNYSRLCEEVLLPTIDLTNRVIRPALSRKAEERVAALKKHSPPTRFLRHHFFSGLLSPAISRFVQKTAFAQTAADTAALACALERYRLAHGQFPDSLEALTPQFISPLPHDIINAQPMKYRRGDDGRFVLYSVGWNETDDDGVVAMTRSGEGANFNEGDWVWREVE